MHTTKREEEILKKYKELPEKVKVAVHKRMVDIASDIAEVTKDAQPFLIQLAIENLANQRNLAIIAGSLATVSILMLEKLVDGPYFWMFGLSIVGLLLTTLFAVVSSAVDVERGNHNLKFDEATGLFHRLKEIIHKLILGEISPEEADKQEENVRDAMLKWTFKPPQKKSRGIIWQTIAHVLFVATIALMALFFILRFIPADYLIKPLDYILRLYTYLSFP